MKHVNMNYIVPRNNHDRRSGERLAPPYLTEEGMVLFDRRSDEDRRVASLQGRSAANGLSSKGAQG